MELRKQRDCLIWLAAFIALIGIFIPPAVVSVFADDNSVAAEIDPRLLEVNAAARVRDYGQMLVLLQPLADEGNAEAMYQLSGLYRGGKGVAKDVYRACELMQLAAAKGHKKALAGLAVMQGKGWGKRPPEPVGDEENAVRPWYFKDSDKAKAEVADKGGVGLGLNGKVPEDALRWVAGKGQFDKVQAYVKAGVNVNDVGANGRTALMEAASFCHAEVVGFLLQNRARYDLRDRYGNDALLAAVNNGKAEELNITVYRLLDYGADINSRDTLGNTPLLLAAGKGLAGLVDLLLDNNAAINLQNKKGKTAVQMASLRGHGDIVEMLVQRGAKLDKPTKDVEKPPVIMPEDLQTPAAIKKMAGKAVVPTKGWSTLMIASWRGHVKVVKALVAEGVELNWQDEEGHTALSRAAWQGYVEVVDLLLAAGAKKDIKQKNGMTAISWAAQEGKLAVVNKLIKAGALLNLRHKDGRTPLFLAVAENHPQTTAALLAAGAKCNIKSRDGLTPLLIAAREGREKIVASLLAHKADVNVPGPAGRSALWQAAEHGDLAMVKMLVARQADVNLADVDGKTPIFIAAARGRLAIVKIFLQAGAVATKASKYGNTPLMMAASRGDAKVVKLLVGKYPQIDLKNVNGDTALMLAVAAGHVESAHILLTAGAGSYKKNKQKQSARQMAIGNKDMLAVIEKFGVKSKLRKVFNLPTN